MAVEEREPEGHQARLQQFFLRAAIDIRERRCVVLYGKGRQCSTVICSRGRARQRKRCLSVLSSDGHNSRLPKACRPTVIGEHRSLFTQTKTYKSPRRRVLDEDQTILGMIKI